MQLYNPDYNNGQGMRIHIRTKQIRWWSYVAAAVVQIGDDTLEVKSGAQKDSKYWVNGKQGPWLEVGGMQPFTIGGHKVRFRVLDIDKVQYKIFLEDGQTIILKSVKDWLRVEIENHNKETFGSSRGLLGTYGDGLMMARNGTTVIEDPIEFGNEWQVLSDEPMLFHNVDGPQHPESCEMPSSTSTQRRLGEHVISREQAKAACSQASASDFNDCMFDVIATGDVAMADSY